LRDLNVTFDEFIEKVGGETLRRSIERFQRVNGEEVIEVRWHITWLSQKQLCFQPIFDLKKDIEEQVSKMDEK